MLNFAIAVNLCSWGKKHVKHLAATINRISLYKSEFVMYKSNN